MKEFSNQIKSFSTLKIDIAFQEPSIFYFLSLGSFFFVENVFGSVLIKEKVKKEKISRGKAFIEISIFIFKFPLEESKVFMRLATNYFLIIPYLCPYWHHHLIARLKLMNFPSNILISSDFCLFRVFGIIILISIYMFILRITKFLKLRWFRGLLVRNPALICHFERFF